jgi:Platelet-activating factor acetylhydrolase, isoform II
VLFSPGYGINREQGTALVQDLASHGYVVVTISHTYESAQVQFPGGRVELGRNDLDMSPHLAVALRRDDTRFVLDKLHEIAAGANPNADGRPLPAGLGQRLDLTRVGMFGHSLGGATALQTMAHDGRVIAGIDLDGTVFPDIDPLSAPPAALEAAMAQLAVSVSDRPFMFMTSGSADPQRFFGPFVRAFWDNLSGWRRFLSLSRSSHYSYTDNELLLQQCIAAGIVPDFPPEVDLIDARRAVAVQRAYVRAFFDRWLRSRDGQLLDGPSPRFPEVAFH